MLLQRPLAAVEIFSEWAVSDLFATVVALPFGATRAPVSTPVAGALAGV